MIYDFFTMEAPINMDISDENIAHKRQDGKIKKINK